MTEIADHYRRTAAAFSQRVREVPDGAWDNPAPCEGWVARDVVRHLVEWPPSLLFDTWGLPRPAMPSVDDDPVGAWEVMDRAFQGALDDPAVAGRVEDVPRMGPMSFGQAFDMLVTSDVFLHTWDLARATGLDETLDPDECHRLFVGMEPMDEVLRASGHYGPRVAVPEDADEQTKLLAFIGRRP
jgi:uncharacterized protein (TIGR03086 family)